MHKLRKIFAFFIAFIMTIALLPGGSVVHAAESNSELKLVASREGDTITVNVMSVKDMIFGGMEITLGFDSDQFELEAYSDGKLYETQFDTTAYNPNLRFFSLAAGTPFTATPDGQPIISIKYKVKDGFKADTDYTFTYTFDDCFTNKREDYESIGAVLDVTYRENTVSFELNDGEAGTNDYSDQLVVTGEKASDPGNPTREGYVFKGWKAAETDTAYFDFNTPITKKTTLTADWAKEYEVSYNVTGDKPEDYTAPTTVKKQKDDEVTVAESPQSPVTGTKDGVSGTYTFTGWTAPEDVTVKDGKFTMPEKNVEFTGEWKFTPSTHSVSYSVTGDVPEGYTVPEKKTVNEGASVEVEAKATTDKTANEDGIPGTYTFEGWTAPDGVTVGTDGKFTMPAKDVTFTGTWTFTPDTYTVIWMNGSDELEKDEKVAYNAGPSYDGKTEPAKAADDDYTYTFKGWAKSADAEDVVDLASEKVTKDVTYYAVFDKTAIDKYNVTYKVDGEVPTGYEVPEGQNGLKAGDSATLATAGTTEEKSKDGVRGTWTFSGWNIPQNVKVNEEDGTFTMPASNVEFTGSWTFTADKHTVRFVDDEGKEISSKQYDDGTKASDIEAPDAPGKAADSEYTYTFAGWTPDIADVTADATYTATYTATPIPVEQVTVTFDSDGGSAVEAQTLDKGGTAAKPADPTKEGFDFAGWKLNDADYDFTAPVNSDITLKASWTEKEEPDDPDPQDDDQYTVDTKITGHTYEIYQIFTGDISTLGEGDAAKEVLTNIVWGQNGTGTTGTAVDQDIIDALTAVVGETLDDTKLAVIEDYVTINGHPLETITADNDEQKSVQLPAGYYLIRDKAESLNGKDDAYTTYITRVINNYTVKPKSAKPTVDKKVEDAAGSFGETADHAIGEEFKFSLTATLTKDEDYAAYETYKVQFEDTMSAGLTFVELNSIKINGTDVTNSIPADDKTQQKNNDGTTKIVVTVQDVKTSAPNLDLTKTDGVVEVIYTAKLNENAIANNAGGSYGIGKTNTNSVKLKYSNNPNTGGSGDMGQTTTDDNVFIFTYQINNTKMGQNGDEDPTPLAGAGFRLYKADGTTEIPLVYNATKGAYIPAAADAEGEEMKSAAETGVFNIAGLDAGNYVLKETTVPKGYNKCDDTNIKISATHEINGDGTSATLTLSNDSTMSTTPINRTGSELPTTGGIGTTIFYTVGGILVLGAGILLITRRRMGSN